MIEQDWNPMTVHDWVQRMLLSARFRPVEELQDEQGRGVPFFSRLEGNERALEALMDTLVPHITKEVSATIRHAYMQGWENGQEGATEEIARSNAELCVQWWLSDVAEPVTE